MSSEVEEPPEPVAGRSWYRRWWVIAAAVVVLLAGAVVFVSRRWDNSEPFEEAVRALTGAPSLRYRMSLGEAELDYRVTAMGDAIGTMKVAGYAIGVLTVGDKSYVKLPSSLAVGQSFGLPAPAVAGRWVTGNALAASVPARALSPVAMGARLYEGLAGARFPSRFDSGTELHGVPVLRVTIDGGELFVTKNAPYRVVEFIATGNGVPPSVAPLPSLPPVPTFSPPWVPNAPQVFDGAGLRPPRAPPVPRAPGDPQPAPGLSFELDQASAADHEKTFAELQAAAGDLAQAVDAAVHFLLQGAATVACTTAGCVVTATVKNTVVGTGSAAATETLVQAQMTATVFLNGRLAGTCVSAATPMPPNGTTVLTCDATTAGVVYAGILQQAAGRRGVVTILATGSAEIVASANAPTEVEDEVSRIDGDRRLTLRGPPGTLRVPRLGDRDGGPGEWVHRNRGGSEASQAYQERGTGVERGFEYRVGNRDFDGFENGVLLDAKDRYFTFFDKTTLEWKTWWQQPRPSNNYRSAGFAEMLKEARGQVAEAGKLPVEWRVSDPQFAAALRRTFDDEGITGIRIRYFP